MKHKILFLLLYSSFNLCAQTLCRTDIMNGEKVISTNHLMEFEKYDFSSLWLKTESRLIYGVIGKNNHRIQVKILTVTKNKKNPMLYSITGKTCVKDNICNFSGTIEILKIQKSNRTNFGTDNEFKGNSRGQGLLIAKYLFVEDKNQKYTGVFEGELKTKWYIRQGGQVAYDDINSHSDGYFNNAYVGTWKMYNSKLTKKCNWGDYGVPNVGCDFDIGTSEFRVSEKYWKNGWLDIAIKNRVPNGVIIEAKENKFQKEWWQ